MYNENTFKNYIFWIRVKRLFLIVVFSVVGALIGAVISQYVVDVLLFKSMYRTLIVGGSVLFMLAIALLLTANTGKEVQDGYWKIAVLRKLTVISKKLDYLDNLDDMEKEDIKKLAQTSVKESNDEKE